MATRILDAEVLISHYNKMTKSKSVEAVRAHARQLIKIQETNWILSPIRVEFLCGALSSDLNSNFIPPIWSPSKCLISKISRREIRAKRNGGQNGSRMRDDVENLGIV
jgi:hypothetical protein